MKILLYKKNNLIGCSGGAEKVMCNFANTMVERGHEVFFLTRDEKEGMPFYPLSSQVKFINFAPQIKGEFCKFRRLVNKFLQKNRLFRKLLAKLPYFDREKQISNILAPAINQIAPDVIISCGVPDTIDFSYEQKINAPIIQMFHSDPNVYFYHKNAFKKRIMFEAVARTNACQVLLPSFIPTAQKYYHGKIVAIGNTVPQTQESVTHTSKKENFSIIYMARFDRFKQQDLLVKAFALLAPQYPNWKLNLWGSSEKKCLTKVQELINQLDLNKRIFLCGVTPNPQAELLKSDICAFPSSFEGFSLALTEAMAVGLPCVGLKTASGINEMIDDEMSGFLCQNTPQDFADKLEKLICSADLRQKFGLAGKEKVKQYAPEIIWQEWENLMQQVKEQHE